MGLAVTKVGVVVPASNSTIPSLAAVIDGLQPFVTRLVVVHNDASDASDHVCRHLRLSSAIDVIHLPAAVGKAEAVLCGIRALLEDEKIRVFVQVDAHHKQPSDEVRLLVSRVKSDGPHLCVADRYAYQNLDSQPHRRASTGLWSQLVWLATGYRLRDTVSGMRAYTRDLAKDFVSRIRSYGYGLELAELVVASHVDAQVTGVGVRSGTQADSTSAEKIEDNVSVMLEHGRFFSIEQRLALCRLMTCLKQRVTFEIPAEAFDLDVSYRFDFVPHGEDGEPSYRVRRLL